MKGRSRKSSGVSTPSPNIPLAPGRSKAGDIHSCLSFGNYASNVADANGVWYEADRVKKPQSRGDASMIMMRDAFMRSRECLPCCLISQNEPPTANGERRANDWGGYGCLESATK
ncbi:hypothetical protein ZHAS_00012917 [Anopheles sinensis]|uniref:Uncharacterized protein n=1 Tax=Anopheles sinensis TaxID=74873 RepID=A0A084W438_ANOSI|nr:hypothetical protein ZHAS_00012917 [Anopheles sinensis]